MSATTTTSRTGARRMAEIPQKVRTQLHQGEVEARTLVEMLSIDFVRLLKNAAPELPPAAVSKMRGARELGISRRMAIAGTILYEHFGAGGYLRLVRHRSDMVRSWAAFLLASSREFSLGERLRLVRPLANDHNPGVREWAWLALRSHLREDLEASIEFLSEWTQSPSPFLRRFASEATRPRGVWCAHIDRLKREPALGLPILEPLRADPHRYVQDSVGNWLNDAAKTRPDWVRETCARWRKESASPATERICRRGLRSL